MEYCEQSGITPKLHCLYYDKFVPTWLQSLDDEAFDQKYLKRLTEISERYSGRMFEFEVVNEIFTVPLRRSMSIAERGELVRQRFELVRKFFPNEKLTINESQLLFNYAESGGTNTYASFIEKLLASGTQIDRIGLQNHIFTGVTAKNQEDYDQSILNSAGSFFDPDVYFNGLDLFAKLGLPLEFTEVTIPTFGDTPEDEELQAELVKLLYSIWFSHPAVDCIVYWNTVDGLAYESATWNENNCKGGLFHRDLTPKRSALTIKRLFSDEWRTNLTLTTDADGYVSFRGFYGAYTVEGDGVKMDIELKKDEK